MSYKNIGCICADYDYEKIKDLIKQGKTMKDLKRLEITGGCAMCYPYIEKMFEKDIKK